MARDVSEAASLLRKRFPGIPFYVLGNSMGAAIAMIAASSGDLTCDGLILVSPALRSWRHLGLAKGLGLWMLAHLTPGYSPATRKLKFRPSDNIAMLRAQSRDPMVIRHTRMDTLKGLVDAMSAALDAAPGIHTPTFVLYGVNDELVPRASVMEAVASLPAPSRSAEYQQGWHMLLRDLNAVVVLDDILAWILDREAPLPSGAEISQEGWVEKRVRVPTSCTKPGVERGRVLGSICLFPVRMFRERLPSDSRILMGEPADEMRKLVPFAVICAGVMLLGIGSTRSSVG